MARIAHHTCPLCEACCGLSFTVEGNEVREVRGDPEDSLSRGFLCTKGASLPELHGDPDRLRRPLRRTAGGWEEMDWEPALDLVAARLRAVQEEHGRDAVAVYRGNPSSHSYSLMMFASAFMQVLDTRNAYSAISMDNLPHVLVAFWMYGHPLLLPVPDLERTVFVLMLGANPVTSNSSMMTAPGITRRVREIQERGGRLVVVDPRRTKTARLADRHLFIRPGTDALFLAALLNVLFADGLAAPGRLAERIDGLPAVRDAVAPFTPERVADATGIPTAATRALARDLSAARGGAVYGRLGTSIQEHGVTCQWLIQLLNLVTGNLDRPGGAMFTSPALDPIRLGLIASGFGRWRSRVRGLPEFGGELPVAALAEEIATPGDGQVRALITVAGNPVLSVPGGPALGRALDGLDFMVSLDPQLNETTRHADVILPPLSPLERDNYEFVASLVAVRNVAKWSPRVLEPPAGALDDWQILNALERRLARTPKARLLAWTRAKLGPRRILGLALRMGPHGAGLLRRGGLTLGRLAASEHGLDLGPLEPRLPGRLKTADGRIHAAPAAPLEDLARLERLAGARAPPPDGFDLALIGRRHLRSNNSWMHNVPRLMSGEDRCTLLMHPTDATARGLRDGGRARVRSATGAVEVRVAVSDEMMPGVVSLPHGYGHDAGGTRQSVATERPGVNVNALHDPRRVDAVSGTAVLNGTPVAVERAR